MNVPARRRLGRVLFFFWLFCSLSGAAPCAAVQPVSRHEFELFTKAREHLAKDRMEDAERVLARYFKRNGKKHPIGYELYGYLLMHQENPRKAATILEEGVRYYPKNASLAQNLGAAHGRNQNHERAAELFETAHALTPEKPSRLLYTAAVFRYRARQFDKAGALLSSLLEKPDPEPIWFILKGMCDLEGKRFEEAKDGLQKGVSLFPDHARMWRMLGIAFHRLEEWNLAIAACEIAQRLKAPTPSESRQLASMYASIGAPHLAKKKVAAASLDDETLFDHLAYGLGRAGNASEAITAMDLALERKTTPKRLFRKARLLERAGRVQDAKAIYRKLAERPGKFRGRANWALAMMAWLEGDWDRVLERLEKTKTADPAFATRAGRLAEIVKSALVPPPSR